MMSGGQQPLPPSYSTLVHMSMMQNTPEAHEREAFRLIHDVVFQGGEINYENLASAQKHMEFFKCAVEHIKQMVGTWENHIIPRASARYQQLSKQLNETLREATTREQPQEKSEENSSSPLAEKLGGEEEVVVVDAFQEEEDISSSHVPEEEEDLSNKRQREDAEHQSPSSSSSDNDQDEEGEVEEGNERPAMREDTAAGLPEQKKRRRRRQKKVENMTREQKFKRYTHKDLEAATLENCFKCKNNEGCSHGARANKVQPRSKMSIKDPALLWAAYNDIARVLDSRGTISEELLPFVLCGNCCAAKAHTIVRKADLPDDYIKICELFDFEVLDETLQKLRAAALIEEGAPRKRNRVLSFASQEMVAPLVLLQSEDEEDDEDGEEVDNEDVREAMVMLRDMAKKPATGTIDAARNPNAPVPEALNLYADDGARKMSVVCELIDEADEADLFMIFYHEKYTGEPDSTAEHPKAMWVDLTEEVLVTSGVDPVKAKAAVIQLRRIVMARLSKMH